VHPWQDTGAPEESSWSPVERARWAMTKQEAAEERKAAGEAAERQARAEAAQMQQQNIDRTEVFYLGATRRELARQAAEQEEYRQVRVAELEQEMERLDPERARVRRTQERQGAEQAQVEAALRRSAEVANDSFMLGEVVQLERREQDRRAYRDGQRQALLEARADGRAISRAAPHPVSGCW